MASQHITIPAFEGRGKGIRHFFGTRHGPAPALRAKARAVVAVKQVHGTDVLVLDRVVGPDETFDGGWDALATNQAGVLLTVRTADCVPVLVHDPRAQAVAAIHAGWRGAVAGILPETLAVMRRRFGSDPRHVRIAIGPAVGPCCYEVDAPVVAQVQNWSGWRSVVAERGRDRWLLDLRALLRIQAGKLGVEDEALHGVGLCTVCHPQLFFSYRREGAVRGTMVSGIMLTSSKSKR